MKKILAILLAIFMILSALTGCGPLPQEQEAAPSVSAPSDAESAPPQDTAEPEQPSAEEPPPAVLLGQAEPLDGAGVLWRVPCAAVEEQGYHELYPWQDCLLLSRIAFAGDPVTGEGGVDLQLALLELRSGTVLAETVLQGLQDVHVQICGDRAAVLDRGTGQVLLLDQTLTVIGEYTGEAQYASFVGGDGRQLYTMTEKSGILIRDAERGTDGQLFPQLRGMYPSAVCGSSVSFSCVDLSTGLSAYGALQLDTGEVSFLPYDGTCYAVCNRGGQWLAAVAGETDVYLSGTEDGLSFLQVSGASAELMACGEETLILSRRGNAAGDLFFTAYETDGSFRSSVTNPILRESYCTAPVWSGLYGGCFFTATSYEGDVSLLFWDLSVPMQGEALPAAEPKPSQPEPGTAVDAALYGRAAALSEQFGVTIRIADQCATDYYTYTVVPEYRGEYISVGLDLLSETLADYPEGFLAQLSYGDLRGIEINLTGALTPKDMPEDANGFTSFLAFVEEHADQTVIVLDVTYGRSLKQHIYHEISHIIDAKLEFDARYREDALYSEEAWAAMNPEGFEYQWDYHTVSDEIYWDGYDAWFIDPYSRTFPTEDRARILEYAMFGHHYPFAEEGPLREKLSYYAACIRDGFDTAGWPEVTLWEQALAS